MKTNERREAILEKLHSTDKPLSASSLAIEFGVSRQVIVGDVALLRAEGHAILATPRGYLMEQIHNSASEWFEGMIVCQHDETRMEEELFLIIDHGGEVRTVEVEHPIYGWICADLQLKSRYDVVEFAKAVEKSKTTMLASLTDGIHTHQIRCLSKDVFERIQKVLREANILYQ